MFNFCTCKKMLFVCFFKSHLLYISQILFFFYLFFSLSVSVKEKKKKKMLFCTSEMVNFLIGSIRTQQEGTSRNLTNVADDLLGWSGENMLPSLNAWLFGHRRTKFLNVSWGMRDHFQWQWQNPTLKSIFQESPYSLVNAQQEKTTAKMWLLVWIKSRWRQNVLWKRL